MTTGFRRDSRGNRLIRYEVAADEAGHVVSLCGPVEVARQVLASAPGYQPMGGAGGWTHTLTNPDPIRPDTARLLGLLTTVLSLPPPADVDLALALDWYKIPRQNVDPHAWPNTAVGDLVYRGKYVHRFDIDQQGDIGRLLVARIADVIEAHGSLARADVVVNVPGHDRARMSFAGRLASSVAARHGLPRVTVATRSEFRPEAKSVDVVRRAALLRHEFSVHEDLVGARALIVDDVFQSGTSMAAVAAVIRGAGAVEVYGLSAVRTMRS
jgi:predicted amidophosphoribosyltransferase